MIASESWKRETAKGYQRSRLIRGGGWGGRKQNNPTVDKKKNEIREGWKGRKGRKVAAGGPRHCGGGS